MLKTWDHRVHCAKRYANIWKTSFSQRVCNLNKHSPGKVREAQKEEWTYRGHTSDMSFPYFQLIIFCKFCFCVRKTMASIIQVIVLELTSLAIFKSHLDIVLGNWLYLGLAEHGGWTRWLPEVPSNLKQSDSVKLKNYMQNNLAKNIIFLDTVTTSRNVYFSQITLEGSRHITVFKSRFCEKREEIQVTKYRYLWTFLIQ